MTGALLQLVSTGNEDILLIGNPQVSYFKRVYVRYTNFAIERRLLYDATAQISYSDTRELYFDIDTEYGDILYYTVVHLTLPDIYSYTSSDGIKYDFRWVDNIGSNIIKQADLIINDKLIESMDYNMIAIANKIKLTKKSEENYNYMTSNTEEVYYHTIDNNNNDNIPIIPKLELCIPLPFFFNRDSALYIPMVLLRESKVRIKLTLRPLNELYTIGIPNCCYKNNSEILPMYQYNSPIFLNKDININNFINRDTDYLFIDSYLYNFIIFLDAPERVKISQRTYKQLITIPRKVYFQSQLLTTLLLIKNSDVVKELFIIPQRNDVYKTNQWTNYTIYDSITYNKNLPVSLWEYRDLDTEGVTINKDNISYFGTSNIIQSLTLVLNGNEVNTLSGPRYMNYGKNYETNINSNVCYYNFAEEPLNYQPSGHLNLAKIDKFELELVLKDTAKYDPLKAYAFDIYVYLMVYKELTITKNRVHII